MEIDLRLLRHARALADHRNFGRAALTLRISQPALSRSIAQLEAQIGTRLFEREATGVEPTEAGQLLLERATDLLTHAADLGREMDALNGLGHGELHVGAGTYPAEMLVGTSLAALVQKYPDVRARVVVDNVLNLIPLLRRRVLDIVIGDATLVAKDPEFLVTELVARQGYFVVRAGHPLLERVSPTLMDVVTFPLVATSRLPTRVLAPFISAAQQSNDRIKADGHSMPSIACESLTMMKSIVAGSNAIAILPLAAVATELAAGQLAVLPLVEPWLRASFAIIQVARRMPPPSTNDFAQLLLMADAELSRLTEEMGQRLFASQ